MGVNNSKLKKELINSEENVYYYACDSENRACFIRQADEKEDKFVIKVDGKKLLDKSYFFQMITKPCYEDDKCLLDKEHFVKVKIPVSNKVFKSVIKFVDTGKIKLDIANLLETCLLANYLQIKSLPKLCLEHFTCNLKQETVNFQLEVLAEYTFLDHKFLQRATMFQESGKPSYSGLYFVQDHKENGPCLKMFSKATKSVHVLSEFDELSFSSLVKFDHTLCAVVEDRGEGKMVLFQYDLFSGKTINTVLENLETLPNYKASICSSEQNLFVVGETVNMQNERLLSLKAFEKNKFDRSLKVFSEKTFNKSAYVFFCQFYDKKLYVFYRLQIDRFNSFQDTYLLVICSKTFRIISDQRLSNMSVNLKRGQRLDDFNFEKFEKMFYYEKKERLYIKINCSDIGRRDPWESVLVFDMRNNNFYVHNNFLPRLTPFYKSYNFKFTVSKSGTIYGVRRCYANNDLSLVCTEVRAFRFEFNMLIDGGVKWKSEERLNYNPVVTCALFV